ncbi:MAG TPA: NAD(P)-dependent oxidoreductase [Candidatus Paceibacterota bacterium]|nr:NAD(P)-dependent oxidoreductase [Candidatus Paceibacterota bacterium]
MKILVTGATGFIGSNLVERCIENGDEITALIRPTTNTTKLDTRVRTHNFTGDMYSIEELFAKNYFNGVIHLATHFLAQHRPQDITQLLESNISFGTKLLDVATRHETPWFINTSTFVQYAADGTYAPMNLYAATKQAFADIVRYYAETSPTTIIDITLFDTFGKGDTRRKLANILLEAAQKKMPLDMSPGEQILDISPIENIIDGFERMLELLSSPAQTNLRGKSFVLSSGEQMTLRDFVALFGRICGHPIDARFGALNYRPREIMLPLQHGLIVPGWEPRLTLEEALTSFIGVQK